MCAACAVECPICSLGWEGVDDDCRVLIDNCEGVTCASDETCIDGYDSYHCQGPTTSMQINCSLTSPYDACIYISLTFVLLLHRNRCNTTDVITFSVYQVLNTGFMISPSKCPICDSRLYDPASPRPAVSMF